MSDGVANIHEKIRSFQRKYYLNIFIRGIILTLSILIGYFVLASVLEHALWLNQASRLLIFIAFFAVAGFCAYKFLNQPFRWWLAKRGLNDEQAARIIGASMPGVKDRLVNLIQLSSTPQDSALTYASIQQKTQEFAPLNFETTVDLGENKKYLKYLAIPVVIVLAILIINQNILFQSTDRIVHFNREYTPEAPFQFLVSNESLTAFYNENFLVEVELKGKAVPPNAYLVTRNQRYKLENLGGGKFSYTIERLQQSMTFQIEAAGFYSEAYSIELVSRPEVNQFNVDLIYPRYIQRKNEKIINAGNLEVPEGTEIRWRIATSNAERASIKFTGENTSSEFQSADNQLFTFSKKFKDPDQYEIALANEKSTNKEKIAYRVDVIKDQFPQIVVNNYKDSILYERVILGGMIGDDYGVTQLALNFRVRDEDQKERVNKTIRIPAGKNQLQQSFFYNWSVDSLDLQPGDQLEYYLQVWDNDGVNGRKSTKSATYNFLVPTQENLIAEISKSQNQTQSQIDKSVEKANKLQDQIEQANQKLKGKQNLDWQDKKMLEDIINQKNNLDQMVQQLQEQNKLLEDKKDAFTEQDERIKEKAEQIKKLMQELLDDETKKLFEELQKLLNENQDVSQIQKLLDKMNQNSNNLEKELERTLELFKQLQYDFKLDQTINDLKKQVEEQKELLSQTEQLEKEQKGSEKKDSKNKNDKGNEKSKHANKDSDEQKNKDGNKSENSDKDSTDKNPENKNSDDKNNGEKANDKNPSSENEKLAQEQEKLMEDFQKTKEKIDELEKLGQELDKNEEMPGEEDSKEVEQQQQQSKEQLQQNQPSKSKAPQQKAIKQMQQMQEQMEGMQSSMMMDMNMENIESLRQILHGLVKLSFDQEGLIKEFNELQQSDPRFNTLAQQQLKLKDDSKVLEDSLLALGKRDPMMGSFITKEIGELNGHMDKVIESNRERRRPQAASEMQMTMTSINNLALMLDDHFDMMMQMMMNAKPGMSSKQQKQKQGQKSLGQMQQELNQKIQQLKESGKSGRQLSEELAEMAAEQERIRRALQEMQEKMKNQGITPGGDIPGKMEQTEMDLVNKQITDQLIKRQKEILTRLLETEKSMREQDMDEERKGETAKDYEKEIPKAFEEYLRLKEKEVELLKTIPPKLYPYYKKEVSEYFKRMGTNE
jgi:hypothetical protein